MKHFGKFGWKLVAVAVLAITLLLPAGAASSAAPAPTQVNIPAEVVGVDGNHLGPSPYAPSVYFNIGGSYTGPFYDGDIAPLNAATYSWVLRVNTYSTPLRTGFVANGTNQLNVTAADYCKRYVVIPSAMKNLDGSPAYITDRWLPNTYKFFNNNSYYLPLGSEDAYYLTVNNYSSLKNKVVDCTPLQVGEMTVASYCGVKINIPANLQALGATVRIYGIGQTFVGGETVVLPIGQTITWYLKVNGVEAAHTGKAIDCTPVTVTGADYGTVTNNSGQTVYIYGQSPLAAGGTIVLPTGGYGFDWKYASGSYTHATVVSPATSIP